MINVLFSIVILTPEAMKALSGIYEAKTIDEAKTSCEWMVRETKKRYGEPPSEERIRSFAEDYVATKEEVDALVTIFLENSCLYLRSDM